MFTLQHVPCEPMTIFLQNQITFTYLFLLYNCVTELMSTGFFPRNEHECTFPQKSDDRNVIPFSNDDRYITQLVLLGTERTLKKKLVLVKPTLPYNEAKLQTKYNETQQPVVGLCPKRWVSSHVEFGGSRG